MSGKADMILILPNNPAGFSSAGTGNHTQLKNCGLILRQAGIKSLRKARRVFLSRVIVSLGPLAALIAVVEPFGSSPRPIQWSRKGMRKPRGGISYADGYVIHAH
jgi:hypothetical protein